MVLSFAEPSTVIFTICGWHINMILFNGWLLRAVMLLRLKIFGSWHKWFVSKFDVKFPKFSLFQQTEFINVFLIYFSFIHNFVMYEWLFTRQRVPYVLCNIIKYPLQQPIIRIFCNQQGFLEQPLNFWKQIFLTFEKLSKNPKNLKWNHEIALNASCNTLKISHFWQFQHDPCLKIWIAFPNWQTFEYNNLFKSLKYIYIDGTLIFGWTVWNFADGLKSKISLKFLDINAILHLANKVEAASARSVGEALRNALVAETQVAPAPRHFNRIGLI